MASKIIKSAEQRGDRHTGWQSGDPTPRKNPLNKATGRVRQVYPSSEIAHKWAHQTQEAARNAQGNFYFRGPTIYSYRDSWPLARIYTRKDGAQLVLSNSERYSNTTNKHQHAVNLAVRHMTRVDVPWVAEEHHDANIKHLTDTAAAHLKKAQRTLSEGSASYEVSRAREALENAARYMAFFNIRRKAPVIPQADYDAAIARARRIENPDPASADKRERARAQRAEAKKRADARKAELAAAHDMAFRTDWRLFGAFNGYAYGRNLRPVMLRVNGDDIETSLGARVPLAAAPMVWNLVQRAVRNGGYHRNGFKAGFTDSTGSVRHYTRPAVVSIGDYPLDRIDADGTLHAGCHTIPYSELAMMARALNLS